MIHHATYYEINDDANPEAIEEMVRAARTWLLKIPEVLSVRSGRNLDLESEWQFFFAIEVGSLSKLSFVKEDGYFLKFIETYVSPYTLKDFSLEFELDPSKSLKYS